MKYTYAYKTSDGARHEAAMEATSREAVFAALRAQGIRAIKVVAADGTKANGEIVRRGIRKRVFVAALGCTMLCVGLCAYWAGRSSVVVETSPRHWLPDVEVAFDSPSEELLAAFARPGRDVDEDALVERAQTLVDEFRAGMNSPVKIRANEGENAVELKRIVAGLKGEAKTHIRNGADFVGVVRFFIQRQKMESALRRELLDKVNRAPSGQREMRLREVQSTLKTLGLQPIIPN